MAKRTQVTDTGLTLRDVLIEACEAEVSVSSHLLMVAKQFKVVGEFLEACKKAEDWLLTEDAGKWQRTADEGMPRSWINAKSNIKAAFGFEGMQIPGTSKKFHLRDFDTESALRAQLTELRSGDKGKTKGNKVKAENITKGLNTSLQEKFGILLRNIKDLVTKDPIKGQAFAEAVISGAIAEAQNLLKSLVPVAPVKVEEKPAMRAEVTGLNPPKPTSKPRSRSRKTDQAQVSA